VLWYVLVWKGVNAGNAYCSCYNNSAKPLMVAVVSFPQDECPA